MRQLYHYPLDVFGRIVRIYLKEKNLDFEAVEELPWARERTFNTEHMMSDLPTLVENDGIILQGAYSIIEHMEQTYRNMLLLGYSFKDKAEVRRIMTLFNVAFFADVTNNLIFEKVLKKFTEKSSPDSSGIRKSTLNIRKYFEYMSELTDQRNWLAGNEFSLADISAASHISCLDYIGAIDWNAYPYVKDWYARVKSRPSFREILTDRIANIPPSSQYANLDF